MLHKSLEPNALNLYDFRQSKVCPPYFESVVLPFKYNMEDAIRRWILDHTKGRFHVGKSVSIIGESNSIESVIKIGFENPKDMSYFMLACPHLKYK
jgi:hypothetical protein